MAAPFNSVSTEFVDTHFHGRRKPLFDFVMPQKAERTSLGMAEPNTNPHLLNYDSVSRYVDEMHDVAPGRIWKASIYITSNPLVRDAERLHRRGLISHAKSYPPHGSTHTEDSVDPLAMLDKNSPVGKFLCAMEDWGLPLKRHAEIPHQHGEPVDAYHREALDLAEYEPRFIEAYPRLKRILAHLSTAEGVAHMWQYGDPRRYICEITPHHGIIDRRYLYDGGAILPDHHCLPVTKSLHHLRAIQEMIRSMPPWLVAGSDAAGHLTTGKYAFAGFGGLYVYLCDLELYIQILDKLGVLEYAPDFLAGNARRFFGTDIIPTGLKQMTLVRKQWTQDYRLDVPGIDGGKVTPFGYHTDPNKRFPFAWQLAA